VSETLTRQITNPCINLLALQSWATWRYWFHFQPFIHSYTPCASRPRWRRTLHRKLCGSPGWIALVAGCQCRGGGCGDDDKGLYLFLLVPMVTYHSTLRYFVYRLYTTRIKCNITLLSLHVSALLGHHQVTKVYNYDIKVISIQRIRCYNILNRCSIMYIDIVS
jgi:hypothetical protein